MTELNPEESPRGSLPPSAASSEIPSHLRPSSEEDMLPHHLSSQGILGNPSNPSLPEGEAEADDYDVETSVGASINESMMMPRETLAAGANHPRPAESLSSPQEDTPAPEASLWQKQMKLMDQKVRQNPYAFLAGALGVGLMLGRSMGSSRSHTL
jgi:hypothetical protein